MAVTLDTCRDYRCNTVHIETNGLGLTLASELKTYERRPSRTGLGQMADAPDDWSRDHRMGWYGLRR
jgi:hypothetical protein